MALRGIKVIELAGLAPAPFCGMILKDFGAAVTRIDKPLLPQLDSLGRGKQSLILDFKNPAATKVFTRLCSNADVLIDPYRPGVMEKYNLGPSQLCKLNPRLVYARLTGFGQDGPFSKMAGHDINYIAISGVLSALGGKKKPEHPINLLGDFAGGGLICALGICLALLERHNSGKGQVIDANMVEGSAYVSSWLWTTRAKENDIPLWKRPRGQNMLDGGAHFYQTYETKDGKFMAVGALEPKFYDAFMRGIGLDPDEEVQEINSKDLKEKCERIFLSKTQEEWCKVFDFTDACVTPVVPLQEAHKHHHNTAKNSFVCRNEDTVPIPAPRLSRTPGEVFWTNPVPGEHTREILLEAGFLNDEIESLVMQKVVTCARKKSSL